MEGQRTPAEARPLRTGLGWLLLVLVFYVPFWTKAMHIDDGAYVYLAGLYDWNPLSVRAADYVYLGVQLDGLLPYESSHPLGVPYAIKVFRALLGDSELALHVAFTLFALGALAALASLDRALFGRAGSRSALLVLFGVTMPAFLVTSHGVMTDLPTLAFALGAAAAYVRGLREGSGRALALAAVLQLGGLACSYQAVLPLGAVALWALVRGGWDRRFVAAVLAPALAFGVWLGLVYLEHDVFPFVSARPDSGFSLAHEVRRAVGAEGRPPWVFGSKVVHALAVVGASLGLLLGLRARLAGRGRAFLFAFGGLTAVLAPALHLFLAAYGQREGYTWPELALLAALVALGLLALATALQGRGAGERGDADPAARVLLGSWLVVTLAFNVGLLPFSAARYHLLLLPPVLLLVWRATPLAATARRPRALGAVLAVAFLLAWGSAWSDRRQADLYRDLAHDLRGDFPEARLWFYGEWGFRHYMQEVGGRYLLRDRDDTRVGDLVVVADMHGQFSWPPDGLSARVEKLRTVEYDGPLGLRLFLRSARAGFWSHGFGLLPFTLSSDPIETFEVYRVAREPS